MKRRLLLPVALLAVMALSLSVLAQGELTDPYQILNRFFDAQGGLERMKAEKSSRMEGDMSLGGMQGTIKVWSQEPLKNRAEVQLGPLNITQGDNGDVSWVLDQNGKLQIITKKDEITLKRREVIRRMGDLEYADPESDVFTVSYEGVDTANGAQCYKLKITNNINDDTFTYFIRQDDFLMAKSTRLAGDQSAEDYYGDYRDVGGLKIAFYTREIAQQTGQAHEITIRDYVSNPEIDPSLFEPPGEGEKDYSFVEGDHSEDVPFQLIGTHLFIPVVVGCKERLWILDTGAAMSVISKKFADELGLELEGGMKGAGAGGTVEVSFTKLPPFSIQGIQFNEQTVAVIDMMELNRMLGIEAVGILGYDFLSRFVMKVDYANELVSFYDPATFEYTGDGTEVDVHLKGSVFEVQATLDGEHSGTWLFDLGASGISLDGVYARNSGLVDHKGVLALGRGAGNTFLTKAIRLGKIEFAGFTLDNPKVGFPMDVPDTAQQKDRIGILGNTLFRNFVVYCDYANERVVLEKGARFNQPWPEDHSGLQLAWTEIGEDMKVIYVSEGTPADKAGFEVNDVLKSINGIPVEQFGGLIAVRKALQADPGTQYEVMVDRAGQDKKLKIKLAELL